MPRHNDRPKIKRRTYTYILTFLKLTDIYGSVIYFVMSVTSKTDAVWFTTKGQVVIPAWLRKQFHIEEGTKAVVQATADGILLKPVTSWAIERGFGLLKQKTGGKPLAEEWAEHKREEREREDK
jgi:AbrB family looped-hinge helix DNA binding protein